MTRKPTKEAVAARNKYVEEQSKQFTDAVKCAWETGHDFARDEALAKFLPVMETTKKLRDIVATVVLPVLQGMPSPRLGEWDWPHIANQLSEAMIASDTATLASGEGGAQ